MKNELSNSKIGIEKKKLINSKKEVKKINLGIQLLRMILSFLIVLVHFYRIRNSKKKFFFTRINIYLIMSHAFSLFHFFFHIIFLYQENMEK